jgi:hypothetical protein
MLGIGTGAAITRLQGFLTLRLEASVHPQVVSHRYGALANSETRLSDDSMPATIISRGAPQDYSNT